MTYYFPREHEPLMWEIMFKLIRMGIHNCRIFQVGAGSFLMFN